MVLVGYFFAQFYQLQNGIGDSFLIKTEHFFDQIRIYQQSDLFLEHIFLLVSELFQQKVTVMLLPLNPIQSKVIHGSKELISTNQG